MIGFVVFALLTLAIIAANTANYIGTDIALFFAFILVIGLLIYRDRKMVKLEGIVLMRRTNRGKDFIDSVANGNRRFWKYAGTLGVMVAVTALVLGSAFLINQGFNIVNGKAQGGAGIVLPGPVSQVQSLPGAFVVPWWIWIIGIAAVIIPHEFLHGVMCRLDKVRIKSVGWILLIIIPGAFVEPDEKQLKKAKRSTKMRVYAAGSFANFIVALIAMLALAFVIGPLFTPSGVFFTANENSSFHTNVTGSLLSIDGVPTKTTANVSSVLAQHKPGDTVQLAYTGSGNLIRTESTLPVVINDPGNVTRANVTLLSNPENGKAMIGISVYGSTAQFAPGNEFLVLVRLLFWIYVFSLGIGIVNILPIKPLDGGLLFEEIVGKFTPRKKWIVRVVGIVMVLVLLFNIVGPILIR